jgi:hypothetical protein
VDLQKKKVFFPRSKHDNTCAENQYTHFFLFYVVS